jgi:protein involved in polysaccharide export with SLBB domain
MIGRTSRALIVALALVVVSTVAFAQTGISVSDTARRIIHLDEYRPTPGDLYTLFINYGYDVTTGQASRTSNIQVILNTDYTLELPFIGVLNARTLTYEELRREVSSRVKERAVAQFVSFNLTAPAVFDVFVWGGIANPGFHSMNSLVRLDTALGIAGGASSSGSLRQVQVESGDETVSYDLVRYLSKGVADQNPFIKPGDRIFVPTAEQSATITGAVLRPGTVEILSGETVGDVIDLAGGLLPTAQVERTSVTRLGEDNRYAILDLRNVDLTTLTVQTGDIITVPASTTTSELVHVEGAFYTEPAQEGSVRAIPMQPVLLDVPYTPGLTVLRLLEQFGGITPFAEPERSFLIRGETGERQPIPDLATVWESRQWDRDIPLAPGDRLVVPMQRLVVSVGGQVNSPDAFAFTSGYTVADYLELAGGIVEQDGSAGRLFFAEPDGSLTRVELDTPVPVGTSIYVGRSGWGETKRAFDNVFTVTGWITGIIGVATAVVQFVRIFNPNFP